MAHTQTHFELFELPVSFELDLQELSQRYRELQRAVHPDKFANASEYERRLSVEKAAAINDAYQILKSPQRRARYMLELQSVSFDDETDTALDPAFLMEQIELRESLSELSQKDDPLASLNQIMSDIKKRISIVVEEISRQLASKQLNDAEKNKAKQLIHKMQFLNKLQQEAEYQEENLLDVI
ncbi:MAG: Fe-S protein assembly co-chaperone HscB [Gammaproteobacteria bacterium]|nr:Fe-S protein assembly co-chaperone HscB [Gammaproteobacteria bacterium]MCW9030851.1 Fe-S protein assembly co-chaperone HscB [Gammaproteobacteria bacterium]